MCVCVCVCSSVLVVGMHVNKSILAIISRRVGGGGWAFPNFYLWKDPQIAICFTKQKPVCVVYSSSSVVPTCLSTSFASRKVFKVTWCGAAVTPRNKCGLVPFLEAPLLSFC